jgi:nucleoid-associated protein YgaU
MTTTQSNSMTAPRRRRRSREVRQAAARMVIAASKANGETPDPRIVAVAEGKPTLERPALATPRTYTVVAGDTLWAIAERFYGDGNKYQVIAEASGIPNPDPIQPGQVLKIP